MMPAMVAGTPIPIDVPIAILSLSLNPPPLPVCNGEEDEVNGDTEEGLLTEVENHPKTHFPLQPQAVLLIRQKRSIPLLLFYN
jgi:hypothetical protein